MKSESFVEPPPQHFRNKRPASLDLLPLSNSLDLPQPDEVDNRSTMTKAAFKVDSDKSRGPFKRTRTGCMTCRKRKMKCGEEKPVCGQCSRSQRACEWQEVTFRHQQNPTLNAANSSNTLGKFYKGSGSYTVDQLANFVPVKEHLQFQPTAVPGPSPAEVQARQAAVAAAGAPNVPDHTLQTLAAAAVQHPPYPPPSYDGYPTYSQLSTQAPQAVPNSTINALLNPSTTPTAMIDPNLDGPSHHRTAGLGEHDRKGEMLAGIRDHAKSKEDAVNGTDTQLAHALQGFSDGSGQAHEGSEIQG